MFVVIGHTCSGDDLYPSKAHKLFTSADRWECEAKMEKIKRERDDWFAAGNQVPWWQQCVVHARFEVRAED
jgi:hypothetical protein